MKLLLIRHAEPDTEHGPRPDPPLSALGRAQGRALAAWLAREPLAGVYTSPLLRARGTAEIAKKGLITDAKVELADELTPSAAPDQLIARLADLADKPVVLCVGHEPHLSTTISAMVSGKIAASLEVKKAGACCIRFTGIPKAGAGTLLWLLPPKVLRLIAAR